MTAPHSARVSRRIVVVGLAAVPAAALGSCSLSPVVRATSLAEVPDADARRRWTAIRIERDLAALVAATAAAHPDLAEPLTTYAGFHREHVAALRSEGPLPRLADDNDDVPPPEVGSDPVSARDAVVAAEQDAVQQLLEGCASSQGPRLATVLAATAASDAGIATLVEAL